MARTERDSLPAPADLLRDLAAIRKDAERVFDAYRLMHDDGLSSTGQGFVGGSARPTGTSDSVADIVTSPAQARLRETCRYISGRVQVALEALGAAANAKPPGPGGEVVPGWDERSLEAAEEAARRRQSARRRPRGGSLVNPTPRR